MPSCYVCGHSSKAITAKGLSFHQAPRNITSRHILDQWLYFLNLPQSSRWPGQKWRQITLCSLHFQEGDFNGRQKSFSKILVFNAVPTQKRPHGPGPLGSCFPLEAIENSENPSESPPSPVKIEGPFTLNLEDSIRVELETEEDVWQNGQYYSDITVFDQDNVGTVNTNGQQKYEVPRNDEEALCSQNERKELCRLCGQKATLLKPIFDSSSEIDKDVSLSTKIDMYLPFKIRVDDPLPYHICSQCFEVLDRWHELYVTSVAADAMLWKTFGGESDICRRSCDPSTRRGQDSDNQCADNSDPVVVAECDKESTIVEAGNAGDCADVLNGSEEELEVLCTVCGMITSSKPSKKEDLFIKEFRSFYAGIDTARFKCCYCYEFFTNSHAKVEHMKNCRELSTICEICGKSDIRRKYLRKHKNEHKYRHKNGQRVIFSRTCDTCGKCYKSLSAFNNHIDRIHGRGIIPKVCCHLCCTAFVDEYNYRIHKRKHEKGIIKTVFRIEEHLEREGVYVCPVCEEIFSDSLSLVIHLTSRKEVKCTSCHKLTTSEKKFMLHVCGEWNCRYCPKICKSRTQWLVHERLHTGEKPIKCRVCDKSFRSFQHRGRHESTHASSFLCSTCGKNFRNKHVFQDHLEGHKGRIFSCPFCQKRFSGSISLKKHMYTFHKGSKFKFN